MGRAERGERRNVRVLKANYIREFSVVSKGDDPLDPAGCTLDLDAIYAREEAALRCVNHCDCIICRFGQLIYIRAYVQGAVMSWIIRLGDTSTNWQLTFSSTS